MFYHWLGTVKLPHVEQNESGEFKLFLSVEDGSELLYYFIR